MTQLSPSGHLAQATYPLVKLTYSPTRSVNSVWVLRGRSGQAGREGVGGQAGLVEGAGGGAQHLALRSSPTSTQPLRHLSTQQAGRRPHVRRPVSKT